MFLFRKGKICRSVLHKQSTNRDAFSLVEVLIAMAILGMAVLVTVNLLNQSFIMTQKRKLNDHAAFITQQKMESLKALSFKEISALSPANGKTFTTTIDDSRDFVTEILEATGDPGTTLTGNQFQGIFHLEPREYETLGDSSTPVIQYAIKVEVSWTDSRDKTHVYSAVTFFTD